MKVLLRLAIVAVATGFASGDEPTALERLLSLAETHLDQDSPGEALRAFDTAARVAGDPCLPCETGAVRALIRLGRHEAAEERAQQAIASLGDTGIANLRVLLGKARLNRAGTAIDPETLAALETEFRALLGSGHQSAALPLAETLIRLERDAESVEILERYLATQPPKHETLRAEELLARPHCGRSSCLPPFHSESLDGEQWSNERLNGRVVLIDFWATWCGPCKDSIPELKTILDERADAPFTLLSFSVDAEESLLRAAIEKYGIDWPQIWDPEGEKIVQARFGVRQFPTHVLLDHTGVVRGQYTGWSEGYGERLAEKIDRLLADVPTP